MTFQGKLDSNHRQVTIVGGIKFNCLSFLDIVFNSGIIFLLIASWKVQAATVLVGHKWELLCMVLPTEATGYLNEPRFPWENCYCGAQKHLFSGVKRELLNTEVSFHGAGHRGSWCCKPLCSEPCGGLPEQVLHARGAARLRDGELKAATAGQHLAPPDPSRRAAISRCLFLSRLLQLCSRPAISQAGCLEEMRVLQGC